MIRRNLVVFLKGLDNVVASTSEESTTSKLVKHCFIVVFARMSLVRRSKRRAPPQDFNKDKISFDDGAHPTGINYICAVNFMSLLVFSSNVNKKSIYHQSLNSAKKFIYFSAGSPKDNSNSSGRLGKKRRENMKPSKSVSTPSDAVLPKVSHNFENAMISPVKQNPKLSGERQSGQHETPDSLKTSLRSKTSTGMAVPMVLTDAH